MKVTEIVKKLGGAVAVSKLLGVTRQAVYIWMDTNEIPPKLTYIKKMEKEGIPRHEIHPKLFRGYTRDVQGRTPS